MPKLTKRLVDASDARDTEYFTWDSEIPGFGLLITTAAKLLPYALIIGAFTFVYIFVPNTRVHTVSALFGALVAGVLWQSTGWVFGSFIAGSTRYTAIYSAFATLILFMIWLYLSWLILLTGSSVAYYRQYPQQLLAGGRGGGRLSGAQTERLALALMRCVVSAWYAGDPPPTRDTLARRLAVPGESVDAMLEALVDGGLLAPHGEEADGLLPATPPERTPIRRVVEVARARGRLEHVLSGEGVPEAHAMAAVDAALEQALGSMTVADLARTEPAPADPLQESVVERAPSGRKP